jgi:hypothetical protein
LRAFFRGDLENASSESAGEDFLVDLLADFLGIGKIGLEFWSDTINFLLG